VSAMTAKRDVTHREACLDLSRVVAQLPARFAKLGKVFSGEAQTKQKQGKAALHHDGVPCSALHPGA